MGRKNFCRRLLEYSCTTMDDGTKCKFSGGRYICSHLEDYNCTNRRAWKDAEEKARQAEYAGTKLTG